MAPPAHPDLQDVRHPAGSTVAACMYAGVPQQHTRG